MMWLLVTGCWLLVTGYWLLVAGCWLLPILSVLLIITQNKIGDSAL